MLADDEFEVLQRLHESAVPALTDGRLHELAPGLRALTVLFVFGAEVDNGGFAACMSNAAGDLTGEAIEAARQIGADEHAELFETFARVCLDGDLGLTGQQREARLEELDDATLEALDQRFSALDDLDELLWRYRVDHPEQFAAR